MALSRNRAFTLIEVMIVVVVLGIIAGAVIPQFQDSAKNAKSNTTKFNLRMLREQLQVYSNDHEGRKPATLDVLTKQTNSSGVAGTTSAFPYGPYVVVLPVNSLTGSNFVRVAANNPPAAATGADDAGWLYHAASGGVWIDDADLLGE
ncbi:MAG: redox-sensing transcriptional repressor Rex [Pirellula sp.]|nr:redox-sensing transcriptional repressor Rex [Pirellula sp.]